MRQVALVATGIHSTSAVASRMDAFARGLTRRGWHVELIDVSLATTRRTEAILDRLPASLRCALERVGIEGDVLPLAAWRAASLLRDIRADVAVVSVPPFSLLQAAACSLPPDVPLVVDYRDPWSAREAPPLVARATRPLERRALRRVMSVTYAGGSTLGKLLVRHLGLPSASVVSVPNGFSPADLCDVPSPSLCPARNRTPLDLVFGGYWYGRNGPGILLDALGWTGPSVARLTVIGHVSPSIGRRFERITGEEPTCQMPLSRPDLYRRLARADAAVITLDDACAVESRIPAKTYDCLAVGVPVIAVCPPNAALLQVPGAARFHHLHHHDVHGLVALLCRAAADRTALRAGPCGVGPTRDHGVEVLDEVLRFSGNGPVKGGATSEDQDSLR